MFASPAVQHRCYVYCESKYFWSFRWSCFGQGSTSRLFYTDVSLMTWQHNVTLQRWMPSTCFRGSAQFIMTFFSTCTQDICTWTSRDCLFHWKTCYDPCGGPSQLCFSESCRRRKLWRYWRKWGQRDEMINDPLNEIVSLNFFWCCFLRQSFPTLWIMWCETFTTPSFIWLFTITNQNWSCAWEELMVLQVNLRIHLPFLVFVGTLVSPVGF